MSTKEQIMTKEDYVNAPAVRKNMMFPSLRGDFWENWDGLWDDLDGMWMNSWFNVPTRRAFSSMNVREDRYELKYDVPGVEPSEITINRQGNLLTVKAEQEKKEDGRYFCFEKTMTLPKDVDPEKIEASLKSGILTLTIPKVKKEEKTEAESIKIEVKT